MGALAEGESFLIRRGGVAERGATAGICAGFNVTLEFVGGTVVDDMAGDTAEEGLGRLASGEEGAEGGSWVGAMAVGLGGIECSSDEEGRSCIRASRGMETLLWMYAAMLALVRKGAVTCSARGTQDTLDASNASSAV